MSVVKKLRRKFVAVFMAVMLLAAAVVIAVVYFEQKAELEYECMIYLLNVHNFDNKAGSNDPKFAAYPPYFVLEIDNRTDTSRVVLGTYFLAGRGVTTEELIAHLAGRTAESGVMEEYQLRYFNGVRHAGAHRVSFIDVSYIAQALHRLLVRSVLIAVPTLVLLLLVSLLLSRWYARPAAQAIEEQTRFISKVSHELKTPLSIIRANIDLIDGGPDTDGTDFVFGCENIRHECDNMNLLIEAMLWAALPASKGEVRPVDLTRLLERETLRFEVVAFDRGLRMSLDAEPGLSLRGDETQLTRLIDIVLDNAVKYCAPGGEIRVSARKRSGPGRSVTIRCVNTGEPIAKEELDRLFKPFYQTDGTSRGAGLGLAIAHEIVSAMNGSIRAGSEDGFNFFTIEF